MLTEREDLNVLHYDKLIMVFMEYSSIDNISEVLFVTFCEEHHSLRIAIWCLMEPFPFRILAYKG